MVQIRLKELELKWPRQWGACWLACHLYEQLGLDGFGAGRLPASRKGTRWDLILKVLTCYRLIDPGSKWRLHRQWTVILSRYTQPERELQLPSQPPPKITASGQVAK